MFWGLVLKNNKRYSQTLEKSFLLSQASLDTSSAGDGDVQVLISVDDQTYLLCTLRKSTIVQSALNINFTAGDKVTFFSKGNGIVHLTGSLLEGFDDFDSDDDDDDMEEIDHGNPDKSKNVKEKKKEKVPVITTPAQEEEDDSSDDDMDEDDNLELESDGGDDSDEDDDDDNSNEDSDDDDENDGSDEEIEAPAKKVKLENKKPAQNGLENGKAHAKENIKGNKQTGKETQANKQPQKNNKLTLQGGVVAIEKNIGSGKEAKAGKKVQVYYEGRLKDTNKVFDSTKAGAGFKFTLGRGEVIKGWDIGVAGMKVGGKRTITIPANLAYGAKGYPPTIPANSQLVFDVELKNVF